MLAADLEIIDLKSNPKKFVDCLEWIKYHCESDPLWGNYLKIDLSDYLQFVGFAYNDTIVCFGGIEQKPERWGTEIVRVLSRFWIHPDYRTRSLTKWRDNAIKYSPLVLEQQMKYLSEHTAISAAMITREGRYLRSFQEIVRLANTVSYRQFHIQPGRFDICRNGNLTDACRQLVAVNDPSAFERARQQGYFATL